MSTLQPGSTNNSSDDIVSDISRDMEKLEIVDADSENIITLTSEEQNNSLNIIVNIPKIRLPPFDFFRNVLKSPRCSVAPMVDASELPFRMLCRKYGADMAWSPMLHSKLFVQQSKYQSRFFTTCPEDRPLAIQFCANDPNTLLQAAKLVEGVCDMVDINFGCPQNIAKRGNYGAFLEDQWETIFSLVNILYRELSVPVSCKIRVFKDREKTLRYAKMIESAGCQLLSVHGRTKEQKGQQTGLADWSYIKMVKDELSIPVIANGNIQCYDDIEKCLKATGADGLMSAEGLLKNPALFSNQTVPPTTLSLEYLEFCELYPVDLPIIRGHLFKILKENFDVFPDQRELLGIAESTDEMKKVILTVEERLKTPTLYDFTPKPKKNRVVQPESVLEDDADVDTACFFDC